MRELLNYKKVFEFVSEYLEDGGPITEGLVREIHKRLVEVRERGEQAIRRDVLIKEHRLSDRQAKALGHILEHGSLTIQDFEHHFPEVNRRSLQRDLKAMVDMGLLVSEGSTNKLVYRVKETG